MDLIPSFGTDTTKTLVSSFGDAIKCMGGDTSVAQFGPNPVEIGCVMYCYCAHGRTLMVWILFTIGYVMQSFGSIGIVKYGNATLSQIMSAVVTPIQSVAMCMTFVMAPFPSGHLTWQVIVSLIAILFGMVGYTYFDNRIRSKTGLVFVQVQQQQPYTATPYNSTPYNTSTPYKDGAPTC
jgi:hypothetical protein